MLLIIMFAIFAIVWVGRAIYYFLNNCGWKSFICITITLVLIGIIEIIEILIKIA